MNRRRAQSDRKAKRHKRTSADSGSTEALSEARSPFSRDVSQSILATWAPGILGGSVAMLMVAVPLQPTEGGWQDGSQAVPVMLWMIVLALIGGSQFLGWLPRIRWQLVDLAMLGLAFWIAISGFAHFLIRDVSPRLTINASCQWLSLVACYFAVRQLLVIPQLRSQLLGVGCAIATFLAVGGTYQYFFELPRTRAEYFQATEEEKQKILQQAQVPDTTLGSRIRTLFENRLQSTEPMATYGLTNSLAAVLSTWLVVLGCVGVHRISQPQPLQRQVLWWISLSLIGLLLATCLLLTKSRTAWLATALGLVAAIPWAAHSTGFRRRGFWILGTLAGVALVLGSIGLATGMIDREVFTEAFKSFRYRLEYWQATMVLTGRFPILGVGPGGFQAAYPIFKLPQASETIADPHNWLLEMVSTLGLPVLLPMGVAVAGCLLAWSPRAKASSAAKEDSAETSQTSRAFDDVVCKRGVWIGAGLGIPAGLFFGATAGYQMEFAVLLIGLLITLPIWQLFQRGFPTNGSLARFASLGLIVFLLNLTASGGISFLGVAQFGFVLLAIALPVRLFDEAESKQRRSVSLLLFATAVGLAVVVQNYFVIPNLTSRVPVFEAQTAMTRGEFDRAAEFVESAREADPYSLRIDTLASFNAFQRWKQSGRTGDLQQLRDELQLLQQQYAQLRSSQHFRQIGEWYLQIYGQTSETADLDSALENWQMAIRMYPNDGWLHAQYAYMLGLRGDEKAAVREGVIATILDSKTPHADLKLAGRPLLLASGEYSEEATEQVISQFRNQ